MKKNKEQITTTTLEEDQVKDFESGDLDENDFDTEGDHTEYDDEITAGN